jgi:NitT/TauT family transport system substrate-binding protein
MKHVAAAALIAALAFAPDAHAADKVRLIVSQQAAFDLFPADVAAQDGLFKAEDLDVSIIYGDGGGNSLQAILTGSQDVIIGVGTLSVISAYAKGGSLTIIANNRMGPGDLYWYVPAASPLKTLKDIEGKQVAYTRPGSSSHLTLQFILREQKINAKMVSAGGFAAAKTLVMSGQVDVGNAAAPVGFTDLRTGETRLLFTGDEAKGLADHPVRVAAANAAWLAKNRNAATRFQRALWKATDAYYKGGEPMFKRFADRWNMDIRDVVKAPEFSPLKGAAFAPIGDIAGQAKLALDTEFIKEPLTEAQLKQLVDIVYDQRTGK